MNTALTVLILLFWLSFFPSLSDGGKSSRRRREQGPMHDVDIPEMEDDDVNEDYSNMLNGKKCCVVAVYEIKCGRGRTGYNPLHLTYTLTGSLLLTFASK